MPLPFKLNYINLWLIEDGDGWIVVDCGFALDESTEAWQRIFAETMEGRPGWVSTSTAADVRQ